MNRIEEKMSLLQSKQKKANILYMVAGLPDIGGTKAIIRAQEEAGVDMIELGIPFSDPVADGVVALNASYQSFCKGTTLAKVFDMMEELRQEGLTIPVIFRLYYNTILGCGMDNFAKRCKEAGVDGVVIPDLPFEEQDELKEVLENIESAQIIQTVSLESKERVAKILESAKGFVCCLALDTSYEEAQGYLKMVKKASKIPVILETETPLKENLQPLEAVIDGIVIGSDFIQMLEENAYRIEAVTSYCQSL